jgi:S-adenosyl-L-methionine hydrolase (adenosine-forming)
MKSLDMITFLTDFGWLGGYVAACEATIVRTCSAVRVLHISHEVPVGDVAAGALVLARVAPLYPVALHLAVIDPGVGTSRRPIALSATRGDWLVGPDNGLLIDAADALGGLAGAWSLDLEKVRLRAGLSPETISTTFHGRDLFAPASALLAGGLDPVFLGRAVDAASLVRLSPIPAQRTGDGVSAPVIEIDRFGNVGLGVPFAELPAQPSADARFRVGTAGDDLAGWSARIVSTYGDLLPGELGLVRDSWGQAALALNGASAGELLGVRRGVIVTLMPVLAVSPEPSSGRRGGRGTLEGDR